MRGISYTTSKMWRDLWRRTTTAAASRSRRPYGSFTPLWKPATTGPFVSLNAYQPTYRWDFFYGILALFAGSTTAGLVQQAPDESRNDAKAGDYTVYDNLVRCTCKLEALDDDMKSRASGSGFVISKDGLVVTNHHVVAMLRKFSAHSKVVFDDGRVYYGKTIASDSSSDIGLIKIIPRFENETFPTATIGDSTTVKPGESVMVVGCPLGGRISFSRGVLSSKYYGADDWMLNAAKPLRGNCCFLQFDAGASVGSSGGPVLDSEGNVIGVMCASKGAPGMGKLFLGISMHDAWPIIQQLREYGYARRGWLGMGVVRYDRLQWDIKRKTLDKESAPFPPDRHSGLLVYDVVPGSPAHSAGIRPLDIVLVVNEKPAIFKGDLFQAVGPVYKPDTKVKVEVFRASEENGKGKTITISMKPEEQKASTEQKE